MKIRVEYVESKYVYKMQMFLAYTDISKGGDVPCLIPRKHFMINVGGRSMPF